MSAARHFVAKLNVSGSTPMASDQLIAFLIRHSHHKEIPTCIHLALITVRRDIEARQMGYLYLHSRHTDNSSCVNCMVIINDTGIKAHAD